jgi:hypothetical protein
MSLKKSILQTVFVSAGMISLIGCTCYYGGFEVKASASTGLLTADQVIKPQKITLIAPDFYGNGCPPSSNAVTSVDFYNGSIKIGKGTKDVNTFTLIWDVTPGKDGVADLGITEVTLTAVDQTGYRSPQSLKFKISAQ